MKGKARGKEGARSPIVCAETRFFLPTTSLLLTFSPLSLFFSSRCFHPSLSHFLSLSPSSHSLSPSFLHIGKHFSPFPITENYLPPASKKSSSLSTYRHHLLSLFQSLKFQPPLHDPEIIIDDSFSLFFIRFH